MGTTNATPVVTLDRDRFDTTLHALATQLQDELEQALEQLGCFNDQLGQLARDDARLWTETVDLMTVLRFAHATGDVLTELIRARILAPPPPE